MPPVASPAPDDGFPARRLRRDRSVFRCGPGAAGGLHRGEPGGPQRCGTGEPTTDIVEVGRVALRLGAVMGVSHLSKSFLPRVGGRWVARGRHAGAGYQPGQRGPDTSLVGSARSSDADLGSSTTWPPRV